MNGNPSDDDRALLREYVERGSEAAFSALVRLHANHVHAAALRRVNGDRALAEDIMQTVFADFARKAASLPRDTVPGGWLHRHTGFTSSKFLTRERSRRTRESEAAAMNAQDSAIDDSAWMSLSPVLDRALDSLPAGDRDAVVLRFFEKRNYRAVGQALGVSEDTAQKRVSRALGKLRAALTARGFASGASLSVLLTAFAAPEAPAAVISGLPERALARAAASSGGIAAAWGGLTSAARWRIACTAAAVAIAPAAIVSLRAPAPAPASAPLHARTPPAPESSAAEDARPVADRTTVPEPSAADLVAAAAREFRGGAQNVSAVSRALAELTRIRPQDARIALREIAAVPDVPARILLYRYFLSHWAESDPGSALHFATTQLPEEHRLMVCDGVLTAWASNNPEAALAWRQKSSAASDTPMTESLMASIFKTLASRDPDEALKQLEFLGNPNDRAQALRGVLDTVQNDSGRQALLERFGHIQDTDLRLQARRALVESWARYDPDAAAAWVDSAEPAWERTRLMDSLGLSWLQNNPSAAAHWWIKRAPGPDTLVKIINVWAQLDPNAAGSWLSSHPPGPGSDTARMTFARQVTDLDPESALAWADTITDPSLRESTIDQIWSSWHARDSLAATSYLRHAAWPPERTARLHPPGR